MLYPTINQLTNGNFNRYELVIATAKCARMVTDEYVRQREAAEKAVAGGKESDKAILNMIDKELKDEKAVKIAINRIHVGEYSIVEDDTILAAAEETEETEEASEEPAEEEAQAEAEETQESEAE